MSLLNAVQGKEYIIKSVHTDDEEMNSFLFSLGCYGGEVIKVISRKKSTLVVAFKNARYSIDNNLANAIVI